MSNISAKLTSTSGTSAVVADGQNIRVLARTVGGAVSSGGSATTLRSLTDVNATVLEDGALLIYDAPSDSFKTTTTIDTDTGTIIMNGGVF